MRFLAKPPPLFHTNGGPTQSATNNLVRRFGLTQLFRLGAVAFAFCGWISGEVVANGQRIAVVEERQRSQFEQLREDIGELKKLLAGQ